MTEYLSETYKAVVNEDGLLKVWQLAPQEALVIRSTPDGGHSFTYINAQNGSPTERKLLASRDRSPVFVAGYTENNEWEADIDCGAQRRNDVVTHKDIIGALSKCGFDNTTIKAIVSECKKHKVTCVPRYY